MRKKIAKEMSESKSGHKAFRDAMDDGLGKNTAARFNYKTSAILGTLLCCRIVKPRAKLRMDPKGRNTLFFFKGLERLDTELDMGYLIKQVRILRYFLRTVLSKD